MMRPSRLLPLLLLALLLVPVAHAGEPETPVRLAPPADLLRFGHSAHFGIYIDGAKVGWALDEYVPDVRDGQKVYLCKSEMRVHLAVLGDSVDLRATEEVQFASTPPYAFLRGFTQLQQVDEVQRTEVVPVQEGFKAVVSESGQQREIHLGSVDYAFTDVISSTTWLAEPRAVGDTLVTRAFSLDDLKADIETSKVVEVTRGRVDGVETSWCDVEVFSERDGRVGRFRTDASGFLISADLTDGFELRREPARVARDVTQIVDVFVRRLVRLDRALGNPQELKSCVFAFEGPGADTLFSGPRQTVTFDAETGVATVRTGSAGANRIAATEKEIVEALEETVELPIHDKTVVAMARQAIGGATDPVVKVHRLVAFVGNYIEDAYGEDSLSVLEVVRKRKGDCTEHADLFTTLARASGIPARTVGGVVYGGDEMGAFGGHAWSEVVLDGRWREVDPSWEETQVNATHVRFSPTGNRKEEAHLGAGAKARVIEITRR